jgi:putative DNA primase/helicase
MLDQALAYATRGWHVLPLHTVRPDGQCTCGKGDQCASPAKHPRWHEDDLNSGLQDATTDPTTIRRWWSRWKDANIGIRTGAISGLLVLDVDPDHGGETSLENLEQSYHPLPPGPRALTGGDGIHYLFAHPGGDWPNTASAAGPGLDTRGDGGYICFTAGHQVIRKGQQVSGRKGYTRLVNIEDVRPGDVLIGYDETTGRAVETTVQEAGSRAVDETLVLKFGLREGVIRLTAEHPLYTTEGWKAAGDVKPGDELFHVDRDFVGLPPIGYTAPKGTQPPKTTTKQKRAYVQQVPSHRTGRITGYEKFVLAVAEDIGLPLRYCGDGSLVIRSGEFRLQPDFIIEGTKKLVEVSIDWHHHSLTGAPDTALRRLSTEQRIPLYEAAGYECIFIDATAWGSGYNEHTLELIDELRKTLVEYAGNGLRVDFISRLVEPVEVFNLHCEPHNNYFVKRLNKGSKYLLAHNCAPPSRHISGGRYDWLDETSPLPDAPGWLLQLIKRPDPPARTHTPAPAAPRTSGDGTPYGLAAFDREIAELARAVEGTRNNTLIKVAMQLLELVNGGELNETFVVDQLRATARAVGLLESEIDTTLDSAVKRTAGAARTAPPREARTPVGQGSASRRGANTTDEPPPEPDHDTPACDEPDDEKQPASTEDTDLGNARRLVAAHGDDLHWIPQWGKNPWIVWNGQRWARDVTGEIERKAKHATEAILTEAILEPDDDKRKRRMRHAFDSQKRGRIEAMVALARSEPGIPAQPAELDADPWLLNVLNGTLDLRTGELRPHHRKDLITKIAPVVYDPDAQHPTWDRFLHDSTDGDQRLADFLARAVGYSLTGSTAEEVLFFVHGPAAAGKSTFIDAVEATLGDYSKRSDFETFLARQSVGGPRPDIARLIGARFVNSVEVDDGAKLAEGLVKTLTGGDMVTARFLYGDDFEFRPQFKLWLAANHAPRVHHGDQALWRRILRIPFDKQVPLEERDPQLKATLRDPGQAGPAILAWAVRGCIAWQHGGLQVPPIITTATEEYRSDMDPLRDFLAEYTVVGDTDQHWVTYPALRSSYEDWAREVGLRRTLSPNAFADALRGHGLTDGRRRVDGRTQRIWHGIRLITITDPVPDELDFGRPPAAGEWEL